MTERRFDAPDHRGARKLDEGLMSEFPFVAGVIGMVRAKPDIGQDSIQRQPYLERG
jgi:hypothetical protein